MGRRRLEAFDRALRVINNEVKKLEARSNELPAEPLTPRDSDALNQYMRTLLSVNKENRIKQKDDNLKDMTEEELIALAKSAGVKLDLTDYNGDETDE